MYVRTADRYCASIPLPDRNSVPVVGKKPVNENLFSHPAEAQYVAPVHEGVSDPVENPVFSDQEPQIHQ